MPVVSLDGFKVGVTLGTDEITTQVLSGDMTLTAPAETIHTLGGPAADKPNAVVSQTSFEGASSGEFLYDEADGAYDLLFEAMSTFSELAFVLVGGVMAWNATGKVTDLGFQFDAEGGKSRSTYALQFSDVTRADAPVIP